jgi:anthranilate synthase component 1
MTAASMFEPEFAAFTALYDSNEPALVSLRLVADLETPVSAFLKLSRDRAGDVFLLESVEGGAARGRYSMIGLDPDVIFRVQDGKAEINRDARRDRDAFVALDKKPLDALRDLLDESAIPSANGGAAGLPPMAAGVFGYLGYDMVREMERLASAKPDPIGTPDALLVRPTLMAVFDTVRDEIWLVTPVRPQEGVAAKAAYEAALERLETAVAVLEGPLRYEGQPQDALLLQTHPPVSNTTEAQYVAMVEQAKSYIRAGDIFQVVLSQRFTSPFQLPAFALYRALRRVNPAPFLCYLDFGGFQIVCSSPEILVRAREGKVQIRPIAGTRPRGETRARDEALAAELLADPKELSEHLMLLDLGRNDVGRVAKIGTVEVTEKFVIERYSHVMHIVSNVEGRLDSSRDVIDALAAGFPAGTVSGAPKVRAMEIIDELELDKRGIYAGCIGYFGASGEMDTCIVLRTSVVKDGFMHVQAGAGIVYDSDPVSEQRECVNKARALFRAAEEALRFASSAKRGQ